MKRPYTPKELIERVRAVLNPTADAVLSYRVPARTKKAKKRQRKRRAQRESSI